MERYTIVENGLAGKLRNQLRWVVVHNSHGQVDARFYSFVDAVLFVAAVENWLLTAENYDKGFWG